MPFRDVPDEDVSGVFHIYDNGIRCFTAPCPHYTVRNLNGEVYKASSYDTSRVAAHTGDWLRLDLYRGRWLVRGTLARTDWPHTVSCELRVEQLVATVDAAAADRVTSWLRDGKDLRPLLQALRDTAGLVATPAGQPAAGYRTRFTTGLLDELDELDEPYAGYRPQSTYGPRSSATSGELVGYLAALWRLRCDE